MNSNEYNEGSASEEAAETPEQEAAEQESGQEPSSHVKVPEEFQQKCGELLSSCDSMSCLDYLQSAISDKRMELMKQDEVEEEPEAKSGPPKEFSSDDMPD